MVSPITGEPLEPDGEHLLRDRAGVRWPVIDDIAWLRVGRDDLREQAVERLTAGDVKAARRLLLTDTDDWWTGELPAYDALDAVVRAPSLRAAMAGLSMGRVADYFAHRWSDPTYLASLALLQAHWPGDRPVVEVGCGVGAHLRELAIRGVTNLTGVDVVFAKLWLARHFVVPAQTGLVCADVSVADVPLLSSGAYVLCLDTLYFLRDKPAAVARLAALAERGGTVAVGHAHNALTDNLSPGEPLTPEGYAALLPGALLYDDDVLTRSLLLDLVPPAQQAHALSGAEAVALIAGAPGRPFPSSLAVPPAGRPLRLNPLYGDDGVRRWPSERWAAEYAGRATYLPERIDVGDDVLASAASGERDATIDRLARHRVLLDLPALW